MSLQAEINAINRSSYPCRIKEKAKEFIRNSYMKKEKFLLAADDALVKAREEESFKSILARKIRPL